MDTLDSGIQVIWRMMNALTDDGAMDHALAEALSLLRTELNAENAVMWGR